MHSTMHGRMPVGESLVGVHSSERTTSANIVNVYADSTASTWAESFCVSSAFPWWELLRPCLVR